MEDSHYDEFGNYIGPALSDSDVVSWGWAGALLTACHGHALIKTSLQQHERMYRLLYRYFVLVLLGPSDQSLPYQQHQLLAMSVCACSRQFFLASRVQQHECSVCSSSSCGLYPLPCEQLCAPLQQPPAVAGQAT